MEGEIRPDRALVNAKDIDGIIWRLAIFPEAGAKVSSPTRALVSPGGHKDMPSIGRDVSPKSGGAAAVLAGAANVVAGAAAVAEQPVPAAALIGAADSVVVVGGNVPPPGWSSVAKDKSASSNEAGSVAAGGGGGSGAGNTSRELADSSGDGRCIAGDAGGGGGRGGDDGGGPADDDGSAAPDDHDDSCGGGGDDTAAAGAATAKDEQIPLDKLLQLVWVGGGSGQRLPPGDPGRPLPPDEPLRVLTRLQASMAYDEYFIVRAEGADCERTLYIGRCGNHYSTFCGIYDKGRSADTSTLRNVFAWNDVLGIIFFNLAKTIARLEFVAEQVLLLCLDDLVEQERVLSQREQIKQHLLRTPENKMKQSMDEMAEACSLMFKAGFAKAQQKKKLQEHSAAHPAERIAVPGGLLEQLLHDSGESDLGGGGIGQRFKPSLPVLDPELQAQIDTFGKEHKRLNQQFKKLLAKAKLYEVAIRQPPPPQKQYSK